MRTINGVKLYTMREAERMWYPDHKERKKFLQEVEVERKKLHDEYRKEVATDLRKAREEMGISQVVLAHRMNVPRTQVTRMESGRQNITLKTMEKACHAMGRQLRVTIV